MCEHACLPAGRRQLGLICWRAAGARHGRSAAALGGQAGSRAALLQHVAQRAQQAYEGFMKKEGEEGGHSLTLKGKKEVRAGVCPATLFGGVRAPRENKAGGAARQMRYWGMGRGKAAPPCQPAAPLELHGRGMWAGGLAGSACQVGRWTR